MIVQPRGAKSWAVRYRHGGRPRKHTLGSYPLYGLKEARERGIVALRAASEGRDPAAAHKLSADTVESAVEEFLERHVRRNYRPKPMKEAERLLRLHVVGNWSGRKVSDISRADVRRMLERIVERGAPITANRVHDITVTLFDWFVRQEIIAASPCAGLEAPAGKESPRDRVLTDDELGLVWRAAERLGLPFGPWIHGKTRRVPNRSYADELAAARECAERLGYQVKKHKGGFVLIGSDDVIPETGITIYNAIEGIRFALDNLEGATAADNIRQAIVTNYLGNGDIVDQALALVAKMDDGERQRFDAAYTLRFCDPVLN